MPFTAAIIARMNRLRTRRPWSGVDTVKEGSGATAGSLVGTDPTLPTRLPGAPLATLSRIRTRHISVLCGLSLAGRCHGVCRCDDRAVARRAVADRQRVVRPTGPDTTEFGDVPPTRTPPPCVARPLGERRSADPDPAFLTVLHRWLSGRLRGGCDQGGAHRPRRASRQRDPPWAAAVHRAAVPDDGRSHSAVGGRRQPYAHRRGMAGRPPHGTPAPVGVVEPGDDAR